jgi:uncharacterized repeat protein (TIGR01451 family)
MRVASHTLSLSHSVCNTIACPWFANFCGQRWLLLLTCATIWTALAIANLAQAQQPLLRLNHTADAPPGQVGMEQVMINPALYGYFQPVEFIGPEGAKIAMHVDGDYSASSETRVKVGLLVGQVYRFKVTEIAEREGMELYPTIELINRLYPPAGLMEKFPVPVHLTKEDLHAVLDGGFLVRVIYLEDPKLALPVAETKDFQNVLDVDSFQDPLKTADRLGRPMAILRIGTRIPDANDAMGAQGFEYQSPPVIPIHESISTATETQARVNLEPNQKLGSSVNSNNHSIAQASLNQAENCPPCLSENEPNFLEMPGGCPPVQCIESVSPMPFGSYAMSEMMSTGNLPTDEYICDGGDSEIQVSVGEDFSLKGVEQEDTIGHYDLLDGRTIVQPSNRVCIYAPRFAAIRKMTGVALNAGNDQVVHLDDELGTQLRKRTDSPSTTMQQTSPQRQIGAYGVSIFKDSLHAIEASNRLLPTEFTSKYKAFEDFAIIRTGTAKQNEKARIAGGIDAARVWKAKEGTEIYVKEEHASLSIGGEKAGEIVLDEYDPDRPRFRILKVANKRDGLPGDKIEFTIRFDNFGNKPIGNVTIVDSLTTRLEYVPESAQCSVGANFSSAENDGESLTLRWEIIEPLQPKQGGVIRFTCQLR